MDLNQLANGFVAALYDRDRVMFNALAAKFGLPYEAIRFTAHEACDKQKVKAFKPQKRRAKRTCGEDKKKRVQSAYQLFAKQFRPIAKQLLMENESERVFFNKNGQQVVIDDFKPNGEPKFGALVKKVAAMWSALSDEDKLPYFQQVANQHEELQDGIEDNGAYNEEYNEEYNGEDNEDDTGEQSLDDDGLEDDTEEDSVHLIQPTSRGQTRYARRGGRRKNK